MKTDPVTSWRKRQSSLDQERDKHAALNKYSDFMAQTCDIREQVAEAASGLDAHIQQEVGV